MFSTGIDRFYIEKAKSNAILGYFKEKQFKNLKKMALTFPYQQLILVCGQGGAKCGVLGLTEKSPFILISFILLYTLTNIKYHFKKVAFRKF